MFRVLTFISFVMAAVGEYPRHFSALTDSTRALCSEEARCILPQPKADQQYQIFFKTAADKGNTLIKGLEIKSVTSGKSEEFYLPNPKSVVAGDAAPLFIADINGDGFNDLALQSSMGSKVGYVYYYWMFHPKAKKFVLTKQPLPGLQPIKGNRIASLTSKEEYRLNNRFELVAGRTK